MLFSGFQAIASSFMQLHLWHTLNVFVSHKSWKPSQTFVRHLSPILSWHSLCTDWISCLVAPYIFPDRWSTNPRKHDRTQGVVYRSTRAQTTRKGCQNGNTLNISHGGLHLWFNLSRTNAGTPELLAITVSVQCGGRASWKGRKVWGRMEVDILGRSVYLRGSDWWEWGISAVTVELQRSERIYSIWRTALHGLWKDEVVRNSWTNDVPVWPCDGDTISSFSFTSNNPLLQIHSPCWGITH